MASQDQCLAISTCCGASYGTVAGRFAEAPPTAYDVPQPADLARARVIRMRYGSDYSDYTEKHEKSPVLLPEFRTNPAAEKALTRPCTSGRALAFVGVS